MLKKETTIKELEEPFQKTVSVKQYFIGIDPDLSRSNKMHGGLEN